jgi:hypothetical protein
VQITNADTGRRETHLQRNGQTSASREYCRAASRSDAEIIAAVPPFWTDAAEVAAELGYAYRTLKNRLQKIRPERDSGLETRRAAHRLQVKSTP